MHTRTTLLEPAQRLCKAFSTGAPIPTILASFTRNPLPLVHEHGLPSLTPFLGRTFTGTDGVGRYFEIIADLLSFENMTFDPEEQWIVDTVSMAVSLRGHARFVYKETGEGWEETFAYRLGLAEDVSDDTDGGRELKVQEYRVWADTGAAYLARIGGLKGVEGEKGETRKSLDRKASGCGDVLGSGMSVYGSCA